MRTRSVSDREDRNDAPREDRQIEDAKGAFEVRDHEDNALVAGFAILLAGEPVSALPFTALLELGNLETTRIFS